MGEKLRIMQNHINQSCFFISQLILFFPATPEEIYFLIRDIKMKKAVKEKDKENMLLKLSNEATFSFLCKIFYSGILHGKFPKALKMAEAIPVFKKVNSNVLTNYRPNSILSQISKNFEKFIFNRINDYYSEKSY